MEVNGTNSIQNKTYTCTNCCPQPQVQAPQQFPQYQSAPMQINPPQNVQAPSTSGVHIQIINPSVTTAGATAPTCNVNAPNYYPPNYYTDNLAKDACKCDCECAKNPVNKVDNAGNNGENTADNTTASSAKNTEETKNNETAVNTNTETTSTTSDETKKSEKKKIVELTDQYIMNLENYLNSQDKDIRLSAAKEVYARLEEDPSRKDDKALTALINKMLQDPDSEVRMLALAALDGRYVQGDDFTVNLLQNMQSKPDGYGQDAIDAAEILLKMSGKQVEKEVEADPERQKKVVKTETKKETKKA